MNTHICRYVLTVFRVLRQYEQNIFHAQILIFQRISIASILFLHLKIFRERKKKPFPTDIGRQNITLNVNKEDVEQLPLHLPVKCNRKSQKFSHLLSSSTKPELAGADSLSGSQTAQRSGKLVFSVGKGPLTQKSTPCLVCLHVLAS